MDKVLITNTFQKLKLLGSGRIIYLTLPCGWTPSVVRPYRSGNGTHDPTLTKHENDTQIDGKKWHINSSFPEVWTRDLALSLIPCKVSITDTSQKFKLLGIGSFFYLTEWTSASSLFGFTRWLWTSRNAKIDPGQKEPFYPKVCVGDLQTASVLNLMGGVK